MAEQVHTTRKKSAQFKNITAILIIILLISGGIALAYVSVSKPTTKETYFTAEKESIDLYFQTFNNRYQTELDWMTFANQNATETALDFSLDYDADFSNDDFGMGININDIIDNTRLILTSQRDVKAKKLATNFELDLSGFKIDDIDFYLSDDAVMLGLPFLDDVLKYSFEDLGELIGGEDPAINEDDITEDDIKQFFNIFFNENDGLLTQADKNYFKKEYIDLLYDAIPEDAFTTTEDTIDVNGQSITTEKIVLHLDEEVVIDIFVNVLDKLESEDKIREILERHLASSVLTESDWTEFTSEFASGISLIKQGVKSLHMPDGLTSTLWIDNNHIVKRDFEFTVGPDIKTLTTLSMHGEQLFEKEEQIFNYTFAVDDGFNNGAATISGDLFWDGTQIDDTVKFETGDFKVIYTADETIDKKDREFNRAFSVTDESNDAFALQWSGDATYEKDRMTSEHIFSTNDPYDDEPIALQVGIDSKRIKNVDMPTENIKDLGDMSEAELMNYFDRDVSDGFEQWLMKLIGFPGGF